MKQVQIVLCTVLVLLWGLLATPGIAYAAENHPDATATNIDCKYVIFGNCTDSGDKKIIDASRRDTNVAKVENFRGRDLSGKDLTSANLSRANLSNANLAMAALDGANLADVKLGKADLSKADFSGIDWSKVNLSKADTIALVKAKLNNGSFFSGGVLTKQDLINLLEPDLHQLDLIGDNLSGANLSGANLSGVNLSGADLSKANLTGAKMPDGSIYKIR
ncbi:hypothetical protein C7B76_29795 [filamentous cyanobacterium CCP2]|nr:hypothetical protein C7B76_29795 [filamentous cyanobacterium CCP2]